MIRTVFFGSNQYSVIILKKLLELPNFTVSTVVTKPDAPVGRNQTITANPVSEFSQKNNLNLLQPLDFDQDFTSQLENLKADLSICVAYGPPFFTPEIIDIFPSKIINLHPSPLPRYRGAAPGPWQIANGETTSAMSFFVIDELPDHGPIIDQISFSILKTDTSADFYNRAFQVGADHLEAVLKKYLANPENLTPQNHTKKTYFPKMNKEIAKIDWSHSPEYIEAFIRAMHPWPIAWTEVVDKNNKVLRAQILSSHLENGKLYIDQIKLEGKNTANWSNIQSHYSLI